MYMKGLTLTIIASLVLSSSVLGKDIKGRIIDENDKPLEFVNVVLLQDSTFVTGVITNGSGELHLTSDLTTELKLKLSFVGFDTKVIEITPDGVLGFLR